MKADEKFEFDIDEECEESKFTNFEYLFKKVEKLQEKIDLMCRALRQNKITYTEEKDPLLYDEENETFEDLEKEYE